MEVPISLFADFIVNYGWNTWAYLQVFLFAGRCARTIELSQELDKASCFYVGPQSYCKLKLPALEYRESNPNTIAHMQRASHLVSDCESVGKANQTRHDHRNKKVWYLKRRRHHHHMTSVWDGQRGPHVAISRMPLLDVTPRWPAQLSTE